MSTPSAHDYDAWYERHRGRSLFDSELACLKPLFVGLRHPWLEVGVGTGRFASGLGVGYGIDPWTDALVLARDRGIRVAAAAGEALPFPEATFGAVLIALAMCFVSDPVRLLGESRRILKPSGGLVLGELPREGAWGSWYARRGAEGDPSYQDAHFFSTTEVGSMLARAGFKILLRRSTLFQPPQRAVYEREIPRDGFQPGAGFVAMLAHPV